MSRRKLIPYNEYIERPLDLQRKPSPKKILPLLEESEFGDHHFRIICPLCREGMDMHQDAYEIFARRAEDESATRIAVDHADCQGGGGPEKPRVVTNVTNHAPQRRDTLAVRFLCGNCDRPTVLHIRQHKGSAYMWMEDTGEQVVFPTHESINDDDNASNQGDTAS